MGCGWGCRVWTRIPGRFPPLPARPGLFCQLKCQHGRFLSQVPADKRRFAAAWGPEQCPFLFASQRPSFSGQQGGRALSRGPFFAESPCPTTLTAGHRSPGSSQEEPAGGPPQSCFCSWGGGCCEEHFMWGGGIKKPSEETTEIFYGHGGLFAKAWPAESCQERRACCHGGCLP